MNKFCNQLPTKLKPHWKWLCHLAQGSWTGPRISSLGVPGQRYQPLCQPGLWPPVYWPYTCSPAGPEPGTAAEPTGHVRGHKTDTFWPLSILQDMVNAPQSRKPLWKSPISLEYSRLTTKIKTNSYTITVIKRQNLIFCPYLCLIDTLNIRSRKVSIDLIDVFLVHVLRYCILVKVIRHTRAWKYPVHLSFKMRQSENSP